jgi:hypothetical protein
LVVVICVLVEAVHAWLPARFRTRCKFIGIELPKTPLRRPIAACTIASIKNTGWIVWAGVEVRRKGVKQQMFCGISNKIGTIGRLTGWARRSGVVRCDIGARASDRGDLLAFMAVGLLSAPCLRDMAVAPVRANGMRGYATRNLVPVRQQAAYPERQRA